MLRIRNTFWLKTGKLKISHGFEYKHACWDKILGRNDVTLSGLAAEQLFKMAAADVEFWASLETNFSG